MHEQSRQIVRQYVEELLCSIFLLLFELGELFVSFFFTHELRRHRVREDEHPGWQKELAARDEQKEREWNELDEVLPHLLDSLFLDVGWGGVGGLLSLVLVLDDPLSVVSESFEPVDHMRNSVLGRLPDGPRFAHEPVDEIDDTEDLSLGEAGNFKHDGVDVAPERHVEQELAKVFPRVLEPLVSPFGCRQARIDMFVLVVVPIAVPRLLILGAPVILRLHLEPIKAKRTLLFLLLLLTCCLFTSFFWGLFLWLCVGALLGRGCRVG